MKDYAKFDGIPGALFDHLDAGDFDALKTLEVVESYGDFSKHAETGEPLALFMWEDGGRQLLRFPEDGSLFLSQISELHEFEDAEIIRDWFRVEDAAQAEWLNTHFNGLDLTMKYDAPRIWTSDEGFRWRRSSEDASGRQELKRDFHD